MNRSSIAWYSCIFLGLAVFAFNLVYTSMTDRSIINITELVYPWKSISFASQQPETSQCSPESARAGLAATSDQHLQILSEYQVACHSLPTHKVIVSTYLPSKTSDLEKSTKAVAATLREFAQYNIDPVVLIGPVPGQKEGELQKLLSEKNDPLIREYFVALSRLGVRDDMMGTWIPLPEANLPRWNHKNIAAPVFVSFFNRYIGIMKQVFPEAQGAILLNSATYEDDQFEWSEGEYVSLVPYVTGIHPRLVESFGIQGYPWVPPRESGKFGVLDAREYLNAKLAMEAADKLGIREIHFYTGTFSRKYTLDDDLLVSITPGRRKDMLNGIIGEVESARKKGYTVAIHLTTVDESAGALATDWSYGWEPRDEANGHLAVFADFVGKLHELQIPLALELMSRYE